MSLKRSQISRSKPITRTRKTSAAKAKAKATALHSAYVKARDGGCVYCQTYGLQPSGQMQCAHIVSRRYAATRSFEWNAVCLCAAHHMRLTEHPDEHVAFFTQWLDKYWQPDGYRELRAIAYEGKDMVMRKDFWDAEIERLQGLMDELGERVDGGTEQ